MLAVFRTGGQQYKVKVGDFVSVEKLPYEVGEKVEISDVLLTENAGVVAIGAPVIPGAVITAHVVEQKRRKTVLVFKKSRRKNYRRKNGHRQPVTILRIEDIKQ
ncbi:MAG: 50S ribosomal protein L21 [Holosporaceae bacterium]|jgi:large subunit ribosomal protein L21|nr:50S ribosomal protein L21 [Holosporaceae bacterium]